MHDIFGSRIAFNFTRVYAHIELDKPDAVAVFDAVVKVVGVKVDHARGLGVQRGHGRRRRQRQSHQQAPHLREGGLEISEGLCRDRRKCT